MRRNRVLIPLCAFAMTLTLVYLFFYLYHYAPFGEKSVTWLDANIQYLDFFAYLKDVLSGKNHICYTFSKTLGGTYVAVFAYYLSSPLHLLVVFFDKESLHAFFALMVALKLSLSAAAFAVYVRVRFPKMRPLFTLILSLSYALMQYNIAQSSNVFWLDGVYMLPLMLLGTYRLVDGGKPVQLSLTVGLAILFNWYSAAINWIFSAIMLVVEWLLLPPDARGRRAWGIIWRYACAMALGVCAAAALFLPTVLALGNGRGGAEFSLMEPDFVGNVFSLLQNHTLGARAGYGRPALYCGALSLLGCAGFFLEDAIPARAKRVGAALCVVLLLALFWGPATFLFSLLKDANSHWYRYSYVCCFAMMYLAAFFYERQSRTPRLPRKLVGFAAAFSGALLLLELTNRAWSLQLTYKTLIVLWILLSLLFLLERASRKRLACLLLLGAACLDLSYNAARLWTYYYKQDVREFTEYAANQAARIDELLADDDSLYRVSQTATRNMTDGRLTANYNESAAFGYWSISGYTSAYDGNQRELLDRLGYRINGENMCIVNTSILPADALLGVKYVLADWDIAGLVLKRQYEAANGMEVYENPYALPMAFSYAALGGDGGAAQAQNPFEYMNALYSQLAGRKVSLFVPLKCAVEREENAVRYALDVPRESGAVYGNIPWQEEVNGRLFIDGVFVTDYARWLSPAVFPVTCAAGAVAVELKTEGSTSRLGEAQFYWLDLELFAEVTASLQAGAVQGLRIEDGYLTCVAAGEAGDMLFTSVPYDESGGWTITRNGVEIQPVLFGDCLISLPLTAGENVIEMRHHLPGLTPGALLSLAALAGILLLHLLRKRIAFQEEPFAP